MLKVNEKVKKCLQCKVRPEWGSGFLYCPCCNKETILNSPKGSAVRFWNKDVWRKDNIREALETHKKELDDLRRQLVHKGQVLDSFLQDMKVQIKDLKAGMEREMETVSWMKYHVSTGMCSRGRQNG